MLNLIKVYCYELQSNGAGGLSNIIKQSQIAHEAPVLCTDIGPVRLTSENMLVHTKLQAYKI